MTDYRTLNMSGKIIDGGGPAFPVPDSHDANGQVQYGANGMTLRDWFAGQALSGVLISGHTKTTKSKMTIVDMLDVNTAATAAYMFADAMLAERKGTK